MILGLDPGPEQSAVVVYDPQTHRVVEAHEWPNTELLAWLRAFVQQTPGETALVIEQVTSFGMPVGAEVFETVFWSGRFAQAWTEGASAAMFERLPRLVVKVALCHDSRAKDANIRQALIDRFGGRGCLRKGGSLYAIHGHAWSALAIAVSWWQREAERAVA